MRLPNIAQFRPSLMLISPATLLASRIIAISKISMLFASPPYFEQKKRTSLDICFPKVYEG